MTLTDDLDRAYKTKVIQAVEKTVRAVALVVDAELVATTPVDTGRAKSNWLPTLNTPDTRKVEPGEKPDIAPVLSSYKIDDTVLITNNLPYIRRLNDGWSQQFPAGFVERAVAKGKNAVKKT